MKFKNLLVGKQFVWKGDLYIKLKNPNRTFPMV